MKKSLAGKDGNSGGIDKRLLAGSLLSGISGAGPHVRLFAVIGITHNEIALLTIFEDAEHIQAAEKICYALLYPTVPPLKQEQQLPPLLFADLSRLIIKERQVVADFLHKRPEAHKGAVSKKDMAYILALLAQANTISKEAKDKFL